MWRIKRVYEPPSAEDCCRVLVDRLWPRGLRKADAGLDYWFRDLAPSSELRQRFAHDPARWEAFREAYCAELETKPQSVARLREVQREHGTVTLVYAARDRHYNNAAALKRYLEERA